MSVGSPAPSRPRTPVLPKVIGHRGAAARAPENTLAGLRAAADLGVAMVEFDVKLSRDGVPVVIHDDRVDRTTDGTGQVRDLDVETLRALDAGAWFGPAFAGERIPTLDEALDLVLERGLAVNLEIKPCSGREAETARVALAAARARWPADRPPPLVSSFALDSLLAARDAAPDWPRGWLFDRRPPDWRITMADLAPAALNFSADRVTAAELADYRDTGLGLLAYTVNDPARALDLFAQGVDGVFSDVPDTILAAVESGR